MPASEREPRATSGAILAGGRARRLGGLDKSALPVGGRRIIDRQLDLLRPLTARVVIVGHSPERFAGLGVEVVADLVPDAGPLAGLYTALTVARTPLVIALACDLPFVPAALLTHMVTSIGDADACVPRDERGGHPLCACYHVRCASHLARRLREGRLKLTDALAALDVVDVGPDALARLDPGGRALVNVNTPGDYAALGIDPRP